LICIIGGGPSGMMAGIAALQRGGKVLILERNGRLGKKLLATGNGRCNFTNTHITPEHYHGQKPAFVTGALKRFSPDDTLDFFTHLGVVPKVEEQGKIFPASGQATSILDLLRWELEALGARVRTEAHVRKITHCQNFKIQLSDGETIQAQKIILATGGKAHPQSGSDGTGYLFAQKLGHRIITPQPALVQLKLGGAYPRLQGIRIWGQARLLVGERQLAIRDGELLFTNYGLSGLPALALSREAGRLLSQGKKPVISLNLAPQLAQEGIEEAIKARALSQPTRPLSRIFVGWLPNKLGEALIRSAKIPQKLAGDIDADGCKLLSAKISDWCFPISGLLGWEQAQVTAGGVDASEVDPLTMESKLVKNLYFAGEILDIDGDSGGYNLQWAWSSGFLAGARAAE